MRDEGTRRRGRRRLRRRRRRRRGGWRGGRRRGFVCVCALLFKVRVSYRVCVVDVACRERG